MWDFLFGWLIGRGVRDSRLPDSVKQERYDARQARKRKRRGSAPRGMKARGHREGRDYVVRRQDPPERG
jgi:hypothetical protein